MAEAWSQTWGGRFRVPVAWLDQNMRFPPVEQALPEGLLAVGGDLTVERLLTAYRSGIFPMACVAHERQGS